MREMETIEIYTLVSTGVDTDRGYFPAPEAKGSYLSMERARMELNKLVNAEKKELDSRYDGEERSEDHWEAFDKEYAGGLFSRIEILTSELTLSPAREEDFSPDNHLEHCAECHEHYGTPCCVDEESACGLLDEARQVFDRIAADDRAAMSECLLKLDAEFCTCPERRSKNAVESFLYVQAHMEVERWQLQYRSLVGKEDRRLCRIGTCRVCGKALCEGLLLDEALTREAVLADAWRLLKLEARMTNHASLIANPICAENLFVSMFHDADQAVAHTWYKAHANEVTP